MNKIYLRKNKVFFSIAIFLIIFAFLNYTKPDFLYNKNGSLRQFGIGQSKKTIIPVWLLSIILGILSYLFILYYLESPKFK
tara:strand:+ start:237 stop:479 length:243 start_codon:yes stop_codon:yes gene_type:complete